MNKSCRLMLVIALGIVQARSWCDVAADVRRQIQSAYDQESDATAKKDFKAMFAHYSPGFTARLAKDSRVNLSQLKQRTALAYEMLNGIRDKVVIIGFALTKDGALVRIKQHSEANVSDKKTNAAGHLVVDTVLDETWVRSGASWMKKQSKTLSTRQDYKPESKSK